METIRGSNEVVSVGARLERTDAENAFTSKASLRKYLEIGIRIILWMCAMVSVLTTVGVVLILCTNASEFFNPQQIVCNYPGTVIKVKDDLQYGSIIVQEPNDGPRHRFEINRFHREDKLCDVQVEVGQEITAGTVLAVEPGVSMKEFLTHKRWTPLFNPPYFGILSLLCGTTLVAIGAGMVAIPLGLGTAVYLSEYATPWVRVTVKPLLELLAGIPSVVYGYVAVVVISPVVKRVFQLNDIYSALSACLVVGIMILPMIVSLSEDVLRAVPKSLREAAYALGANKYDVTAKVVVPAAFSGILASFLLAISRAVGETMAVALAAGLQPKLTLNPLDSVQTMTAFIVEVSKGDTPVGSLGYQTIFAVGLTLFAFTMSMNLLAQYILARTREKYE